MLQMKSPGPGIRRHGAGWQACAKFRGERSYEAFPLDTPPQEMFTWQDDERARLRILTGERPAAGTFPADAERYLKLPAIVAMTTRQEREQHIREWIAVFAGRRRRTITALEIEAQRDRWFTQPRGKDADGKNLPPYSAAAVNKRLRALSNLWTKLDGRRAPNPVLEVDECEEPDPVARGLPYDVIEAILSEISDQRIGTKKDGTRTLGQPRPCQTKARLRVIAYTGLAHQQIRELFRTDVDLEAETIRLTARRKGKKKRRAADKPLPELLPLIPQAVEAFREFDRLDCWSARDAAGKIVRPFSGSSMWKTFRLACDRLGLEGIRPYDFRHSFLSAVYDETRDTRVTGKFGGHRSRRTTDRYTIAAVAPHVQAAAEKVRARFALASTLAPDNANK